MAQEAESLNNLWFCSIFVQKYAFRSRHPQTKSLRKGLQTLHAMNGDAGDDDDDDDDDNADD
eukprot:3812989-Pyramimonas_sp.AAC.1